MGVRGRNGEKKILEKQKIELHTALKKFTRKRAERELAQGADPSDKRFTEHKNYHVRARAFRKMGSPFPTDATERAKLCASLHLKDPTES